jgi:hypothetical protein
LGSSKIFLPKIRQIILQETISHHSSLIISQSKDSLDKRVQEEKMNEAKTKISPKTIFSVYYQEMLQDKMKETKVKMSPKTIFSVYYQEMLQDKMKETKVKMSPKTTSSLQSNRLPIIQSQTTRILPM